MTTLKNSFKSLQHDTLLQYLAGFLILFVYCGSLFFPLIDKDAAHHANIALYMYEHNNPFILIDRGTDYLDKPHFLFWSTLLFYKLFGVHTFSHRLPAVIFALIAIWSVYKLTRHLSDKPTAKLAAVMIATAQFIMQSVVDARMETPLAAAISFSLWQFIVYVDRQKLINIVLAALGTAIAFSTKGWLGPVVILITTFFYIVLNKKWKVLWNPKTWLFLPVFALCISPVLYGYYLQFDLHPEKIVRGRDHRSGVKFILWDQLFERYSGFEGGGRNKDYFFLYHTFLWGFFPWCIVAYAALFFWLKRMFVQKRWRTTFGFAALSFGFILFVISFSKFKMAHYVVMLLPLSALFTAPSLRVLFSTAKGAKIFLVIQIVAAAIVVALALPINFYFFPPQNLLAGIGGALLLLALVYLLWKKNNKALKIVAIGTVTSIAANFLLNYNFFPQLMQYQGGNELVKKIKEQRLPIADSDIISFEQHAHTFDFYRGYNHKIVDISKRDSIYPLAKDKYYLFTMPVSKRFLDSSGLKIVPVIWAKDYNVARLTLHFLNPKTRDERMDTLMLAKLVKQ